MVTLQTEIPTGCHTDHFLPRPPELGVGLNSYRLIAERLSLKPD